MPRRLKKYDTTFVIDLPLSPLDWYYLIKYSQGYVGELMHPIIVCLHNSIPFFCFDQYGAIKTIIPMLWHKRLPESSKIYDILKRADFLRNVYAYSMGNIPASDDVVNAFFSFDMFKCTVFAEEMKSQYFSAMRAVEESFCNNND